MSSEIVDGLRGTVEGLRGIADAINKHVMPCSHIEYVQSRVTDLEKESSESSKTLHLLHTSIVRLEQSFSDREKREQASRWIVSLVVPVIVSVTITMIQHFSK